MVITAALMIGWAVAAALLVLALTDWSSNMKVLVAGVISGPGALAILWMRMKRLPEAPRR
jgi:hypothetical protein